MLIVEPCGAALSGFRAARFPSSARASGFSHESALGVRCVVASLSVAEQIPKAA